MSARLRFLPDPTALEDSFVAGILRRETVGGAIALTAAAIAVVWANSPIAEAYTDLRHLTIGPLDIEHWAAEGALSLFFFVAGLELKREFVMGSLSRLRDAVVPIVAAACGVAVPALIYVAVNVNGGDLARLGHPQRHGHRLRTRRARRRRVRPATAASRLPAHSRRRRRPDRHRHHCDGLHLPAGAGRPRSRRMRSCRLRSRPAPPGDELAGLRASGGGCVVVHPRERHPRDDRRRRPRPAHPGTP